jgi:hypothetical protein
MPYLFTSESVSEGHPDKVADQISDALIDHFLAYDPSSKVACETLVTTGQVVLAGEVKTNTYLDVQKIAGKLSGVLVIPRVNTCLKPIRAVFYPPSTISRPTSIRVLNAQIRKIRERATRE